MPDDPSTERAPPTGRPPDVVMIITDQWHPRCLGYAGHPLVRTPNLDRLAAEGTVFDRMYTPLPLCMPARASLFTGQTPRGHGVRANGIPLDPAVPTFTEAMRRAGYRTHCCGKIHLHNGAPPDGVDLDTLDPADYPECGSLWRQGRIDRLPLPYYGLDGVDYCGGHGHGSYGDYTRWLSAHRPDLAPLFFDRVPTEPPGPAAKLFNRSLYKWALPAEAHPTAWVVDRSIDFLHAAAEAGPSRGDDPPFCLMCSIPDPHSPFAAPSPYNEMYRPEDAPPPRGRPGELDDLPPHFRGMVETSLMTSGNPAEPMNATEPYASRCAAQYFGLISLIDDQVGRLLKTLDDAGLAKDTLVLFMADHGEALGDHGLWGKGPYHYDGVIRVPFAMRWPGRVPAGRRCSTVSSLLDVAPTVLAAGGVEPLSGLPTGLPGHLADPPPVMPGRDLVPVANADDDPDADAVVEMDEDYLHLRLRTLVTPRYRMTCYPGQAYGELFDLEHDPDELYNLWDLPDHAAVRGELRERLFERLVATDATLPRQRSRS